MWQASCQAPPSKGGASLVASCTRLHLALQSRLARCTPGLVLPPADAHGAPAADVHLHLADVAMEQAAFDVAAEDYAQALTFLAQCDQVASWTPS